MQLRELWGRLSGPTKVGLAFAALAIVLTVAGQLRHPGDITFRSLVMGILIGGGSWGLVSWAIAYAAWDVEKEIAGSDDESSPSDAERAAR
ncbi:MAG: hypothetical protein HPY83_13275 [Anaerolineae bacterium]|nr:hypothetical protein [Anaerolineae bacterium]